jgi:CDP-glucose 4,6-dehydratase
VASTGDSMIFQDAYRGRRVLVTGDTGFKGSWLAIWLVQLGAEVGGFADTTPTTPSHFVAAGIGERIRHFAGDIRDKDRLGEVIDEFQPEIIFHLAAQALVRRSYADPVRTFEVNAFGSLNLLDAVRHRAYVRSVVMITSDKCYQNVEWVWGYRETDRLGGDDPYSASKACAEVICHSYIASFLNGRNEFAAVATARAGNVIGGGDWADDRIIPDCMRAWSRGEEVIVRSPASTRPWQHVLEPLSGYLWLGANLHRRNERVIGESYNFGPDTGVDASVLELITRMSDHWPAARWAIDDAAGQTRHEARLLKLSCDKALADLRWRPTLTLDETIRLTSEWYSRYYAERTDVFDMTSRHIETYCAYAAERNAAWIAPAAARATVPAVKTGV